CTRLVGFDYW
nr:immunoglobulin heavy chain junction region [Mus musculus]MBK4187068.1 immunoglobulin heavy chain junction region [Mus musculus]